MLSNSDWETKPLGDCLSLIIDHRGKTPRKLGSDWLDYGITTLSAKNVRGGKLVAKELIRYVSSDVYRRWMNTGDVKRDDCFLVSEGATLGECMHWDEDYPIVLGQRLFCLRANPKVLYPRYLSFYMTSHEFQEEVKGRATGTSVLGLRQTDVLKLKIKLPSLKNQRYIGDSLYYLNKKIELNQRMNETLEGMAQTLFKSWFVDFDPVIDNALEAGNSIPEELNKRAEIRRKALAEVTANREVAKQFPSKFQFTEEMGLIPEGWEICPLKEVLVELESGNRPKGGACDEGIPSIGAENVIGIGRYNYSKEKYVPENYFNTMQKGIVQDRDVVIYKDGANIGRSSYFGDGFPHEKCCVNEHVFILRSSKSIGANLLFFWVERDETRQRIANLNTNSAQPGINQTSLKSLKFLKPSHSVAKIFNETVEPFIKKIFLSANANQSLIKIRDTLLPKLISGELRVPDVEKLVEEVL